MRISGTFELVLRLLRTSSKLAENLFKIPGDAHQMGIPLGKGKNSLGQEKNFSWAREKFPLGKRIYPRLVYTYLFIRIESCKVQPWAVGRGKAPEKKKGSSRELPFIPHGMDHGIIIELRYYLAGAVPSSL